MKAYIDLDISNKEREAGNQVYHIGTTVVHHIPALPVTAGLCQCMATYDVPPVTIISSLTVDGSAIPL